VNDSQAPCLAPRGHPRLSNGGDFPTTRPPASIEEFDCRRREGRLLKELAMSCVFTTSDGGDGGRASSGGSGLRSNSDGDGDDSPANNAHGHRQSPARRTPPSRSGHMQSRTVSCQPHNYPLGFQITQFTIRPADKMIRLGMRMTPRGHSRLQAGASFQLHKASFKTRGECCSIHSFRHIPTTLAASPMF
jgi:hypothetical protein